jgi:hypothetical protein
MVIMVPDSMGLASITSNTMILVIPSLLAEDGKQNLYPPMLFPWLQSQLTPVYPVTCPQFSVNIVQQDACFPLKTL